MRKINFLFSEYHLPLWLVCLNYTTLLGILVWPFANIVALARGGDRDFAQLSEMEHWFIFLYPIFLLAFIYASFKMYPINRIVSAIFPLIVIAFYVFRIYRSVIWHFDL